MMMVKTYWGVTIGVKKCPNPEFVVARKPIGNTLAYGYKIDKHGILAYGDTEEACRANWIQAYNEETGGSLK